VRQRKFRQGQQRIIMMRGAGGPKGWVQGAVWMGVGAAQYALHGTGAMALRAAGRSDWREQAVRASGGLGKLLWWRPWDQSLYAGGAASDPAN
jgi:succinoglycan biosynthesis protein ExoM